MKLTNTIRESIIRSVMNDVPEVVFPSLEELQERIVKGMPPKLKSIYKDEELCKSLRTEYIHLNGKGGGNLYVGHLNIREFLKEELNKESLRSKAREDLHKIVYSFTTVKKLKEHLPFLEKHRPSENAPLSNLPVPISVMPSLKAAGWVLKK